MNNKERKLLLEFPSTLDKIVNEKFGEDVHCETTYQFLGDMQHHTLFKASGKKKKEIEMFIDGFIQGNLELRDRLLGDRT